MCTIGTWCSRVVPPNCERALHVGYGRGALTGKLALGRAKSSALILTTAALSTREPLVTRKNATFLEGDVLAELTNFRYAVSTVWWPLQRSIICLFGPRSIVFGTCFDLGECWSFWGCIRWARRSTMLTRLRPHLSARPFAFCEAI